MRTSRLKLLIMFDSLTLDTRLHVYSIYDFHLSYSKSLECAKLLVGAGVDVNCRNAKDNTPLMVAAALGHYNILEFLIAQPNIEINAQVYI